MVNIKSKHRSKLKLTLKTLCEMCFWQDIYSCHATDYAGQKQYLQKEKKPLKKVRIGNDLDMHKCSKLLLNLVQWYSSCDFDFRLWIYRSKFKLTLSVQLWNNMTVYLWHAWWLEMVQKIFLISSFLEGARKNIGLCHYFKLQERIQCHYFKHVYTNVIICISYVFLYLLHWYHSW